MKKILLVIFLVCTICNVKAQLLRSEALQLQRGRIFGKVIDIKTKKGLDAVSVQIKMQVNDNITGLQKDSIIAGMFTRKNGDFSFEIFLLMIP